MSSAKKVWAMDTGSATPVDSMTSRSIWRFWVSSERAATRSSWMEQQMQPPLSSTTWSMAPSSWRTSDRMSEASMFTSPISLTMMAIRSPAAFRTRWLSKVVLPAPRNPDRGVTGSRPILSGVGMLWLKVQGQTRNEKREVRFGFDF